MYLTIITSVGQIFELLGGILLASEMIGLLDKIRKWNSSLQNKIQSRKSELAAILAAIGLAAGLLYMVVDVIKKFHLRTMLALLYYVFSLYIVIIIVSISGELLHFLEYLTEKLDTKRVLGVLGVIFLCVGFICRAIINFTTN